MEDVRAEIKRVFEESAEIAGKNNWCIDRVFIMRVFPNLTADELIFLSDYQVQRDNIATLIESPDGSSQVDEIEKAWLARREELRERYPTPTNLQRVFIENATLTFKQTEL